jgi:penicillin amidase
VPRFLKIIIGILGTIVLITVVILFLGIRLLKKSLPQTKGTIEVDGLQSPVKIYRDDFGVPHIFAQNETDLFFAMGYVVCQDRLWQMDLNRRAATGTLSEIFGTKTLKIDRLIRTIGIPKIANELALNISSVSKTMLTAYSAGVNAYLAKNKDRLPDEFILLQYQPQSWTIEHSLAYQRLMAWNLEMAWHVDLVFGELIDKVGIKKMTEILPDYPTNAPTIVEHHSFQLAQLQNQIKKITKSSFNWVGVTAPGWGSNSWVISGNRTTTGKPLLANDPHLAHQNPSIWYEIHLNAPGIDCYGVSLPGIPGIVIGHNPSIAWGLTNVMADGCDFFVEDINPDNAEQYLYQGRWYDFSRIAEEIIVKNQPSENLVIRFTHQGPIISDIHPAMQNSTKAISLKWTGHQLSDELFACYKIMKAKNWDDFIEALQCFSVPAQNYIYADTAGNIGYYCTGSIPIRNSGNGLIPQPGRNKDFEWITSIPFKQLPQSYNPADGRIVTANNKIDADYPYFITTYWEPPYRAERIKELLAIKDKFYLNDFKAIQLDLFSKHAQFLMPIILDVLPNFERNTQLRAYFCHSLETWDFNLEAEAVAPTIFEVFLTRFYKNIFIDEMGDSLFNNFLSLPNIPIRVTDNLITRKTSQWFDNINTPDSVESMSDIVLLSLEQTFDYLTNNLGEKVSDWCWGNIHSLTFEHALGKQKPLNRLFNLGPFPLGGSCTSVNNSMYALNKDDFRITVGPSMRMIVDLSDRNNSLIDITMGQYGNQFIKHFKDQTPLWLTGGYHRTLTDSAKICNSNFDLLILKPVDTK